MSQEKAKAVVIALISEKNKSRKKRKKRKVGIKLWLKKGETFKKLCLQTAVRRRGPKEGGGGGWEKMSGAVVGRRKIKNNTG